MKLSDKVSIFMKGHHNICLDDTSTKFEYGSCQVKNYVTRPNFLEDAALLFQTSYETSSEYLS